MQLIDNLFTAEFYSRIEEYLLKNEVQNCMALGVIAGIKQKINPNNKLYILEENSNLMGVVFITPPHPLYLSQMTASHIEFLAQEYSKLDKNIPGVIGTKTNVEHFCQIWKRLTGKDVTKKMEQGIYELQEVIWSPKIDAEMLFAEEQHRALLRKWNYNFALDCNIEVPSQDKLEEFIDISIKNHTCVLLKQYGHLVAMACMQGKTPNGMRVSFVYTPPELRGNGYASELVARLSKLILNSGNKYCFLYTDLSNPISNSIYKKIGYKYVADSCHASFTC